MKKKMKTKPRIFGLFLFLLGCLLATGHALAGNPTTLTVGGTDVLSGGYWTTDESGTLTPDGASADNYNVYYDGNGTLTLKDATINGTYTIGHVGAGIYAEGDLTIVLEGSSTVTGVQDPNGESQSIRVSGNLTIQGDGSLTAQGAETSSRSSYGIFVTESFTQQGGSVTANGGDVSGSYKSAGLYVSGSTVTVEGGTLTATGGDTSGSSYGISASGTVTVNDAIVTATAGTGQSSYGLYVSANVSFPTPSVTIFGGGSLTARSGSATSEAVGIYVLNLFGSAGAVTVGDNSTLLANSVILYDQSYAEKPLAPTGYGSWLIYGQSIQTSAVGGSYTLEENINIPEDVTLTIPTGSTLTIPAGVTLTVEGTLNNGGTLSIADESCLNGNGSLQGDGSFTAAADAATEIVVPEGVTCANYLEMVVMGGPTVLGQPFAAEGWTLTFEKGACTPNGCTYTATVSKAGSEPIVETFTAHHSFDAEGKCPCGASLPQTDAQGRYQLADAFQLRWFAALVNGTLTDGTAQNAAASAVLTTNIDLTGADWTPIGNASTIYTGTFDGQNHTISGMTLENAESYSGLFGAVTGTVRDFTVTGSITVNTTATNLKVGGAVGCLGTSTASGTVSGVTSRVDITVTSGKGHIGGVVGSMMEDSEPTVEGCLYTGTITDSYEADCVAGVVGYIRSGTIQNCANQGGVSVSGSGNVGGILGYGNNKEIYIRNCYNTGNVTGSGTGTVGAIVGQNKSTQATVSNCCYLTGSADKGQGQLTDDAAGTAVKTDEDFKSGEVACLLQGSQTVQVWGQAIGTDNYPVLTTEEAKKVYTYNIYKGSNVAEAGYANSGNAIGLEGNAVAVVETDGFTAADDNANVIVKNGDGAYTCANLELTDGADFYTPVAFTATEAIYSRTLPESSTWGTIVLPFAAKTIEGASLYEATEIIADGSEESILAVQPLTDGVLEANTPALFQGKTSGTTVTFSASEAEVAATADADLTKTIGESGYTLTGSLSTINPLATGDLFIAKDLFWSVGTENTVGMQAFRAYIDAPKAGPEQVNALRILVGDATSIRQALNDGTFPVDVYNLQGVQLRKNVARDAALEGLPAGIYIVGGKKVVKK